MTETELLVDFYKNLERQGPGSNRDTQRALEFIDISGEGNLKIADLGCGTGGQTLTLARSLNAEITAVDLFPEFLEVLDQKAKRAGLGDRIRTHAASMDALSFANESLDIIWSEGAVYNIGFEAGIQMWREYLKPGGYLSVSEITWITGSRPREIEDYWNAEYPEIGRASEKVGILENSGFALMGYFTISQRSWTQNYYQSLEREFEDFLRRHNHSRRATRLVASHREEISLYHKYRAYYSYAFYIGKKV